MIPMDSSKPHLSPFHQSLILWSAGVTRNKFSQFQRFTVKSPETRVTLPKIPSHVARNFIECLNLKKSNILSKLQGINS